MGGGGGERNVLKRFFLTRLMSFKRRGGLLIDLGVNK